MLLNSADLASIHRYCSHHRPLLERSAHAGCISCGATFAPAEIREWVRGEESSAARDADETAKCPRCGVDAVLPSAAPVALDARTLAALQAYWFKGAH
jgi:DNA-directed RNA polymerase subunit RPC12/RpoP